MKRPAPAPRQPGTVLAGVKAMPSGWPPASLDPGCGRRPSAADGSKPEIKIHQFQVSTVRGDCRCSFVWIPSTRAFASSRLGDGAPVFTGDLLAFPSVDCGPAAALGHGTGFPGLGLLRRLRPVPVSSADDVPCRRRPGWPVGEGTPGRFPRSPPIRSTGSAPSYAPAAIHEYAADLPRDHPAGRYQTDRAPPPVICGR
jgi:hypothetical protein